MTLVTLIAVTLSQADLSPPPPPPPPPARTVIVVPAPVMTTSAAADREVTIRALREEMDELESSKGGYFFPVFWAGLGTAVAVGGALMPGNNGSFRTAVVITGAAAASLATTWLVFRIARNFSIGSQISAKEDQLHALEAQRLQVGMTLLPGGAAFGLGVRI